MDKDIEFVNYSSHWYASAYKASPPKGWEITKPRTFTSKPALTLDHVTLPLLDNSINTKGVITAATPLCTYTVAPRDPWPTYPPDFFEIRTMNPATINKTVQDFIQNGWTEMTNQDGHRLVCYISAGSQCTW